jgi:hypothetical protein
MLVLLACQISVGLGRGESTLRAIAVNEVPPPPRARVVRPSPPGTGGPARGADGRLGARATGQCADWLTHLHTQPYPLVVLELPRVTAILERIPADVDELALARRVADLETAAVRGRSTDRTPSPAGEPDLDFGEFCRRQGLPASSTPQLARARDAFAAERHRRGETDTPAVRGRQPVPARPLNVSRIAGFTENLSGPPV